jgi:ubiquitin carboxyl-terminal hydrolase 6/32
MNVDGHLDLSEMVRGVALLCRKDLTDRIKLCFKLFDKDNDGILNEEELKGAIDMLIQLKEDNSKQLDSSDTLEIVYQLTLNHHQLIDGGMGEEEFIKWSDVDGTGHHLMGWLLNVMFEVCHVKLGMKPRNQVEEEMIIRGYMNRFSKHGRKKGQNVYLISAEWFNEWRIYTNFEMDDCPLSVIKVNNPSNVRRLQHKEKKNSKPSSQSPHAYEAPMAEPVTELVEVTDEGEDVIDSYTHVVNPNTNSTGHHSPSSDPPVPQGNSDQQGLPPIDNTTLCETESFSGSKKLISLTNEGGHLLKNLKEFDDYYVLPEDVWRALVTWHGTISYTGGPSLPRPVIDDDGNAELYPVIFQVYKHTTLPPSKQTKSGPWNSVMEVLGYLGFRSGQSPSSTPSSGPNIPGDPTQPVLPRRILYYTATFHKGTTVLEMCEFLQRVLHAKQEDLRIYDLSNEDQPDLLDEESKTIEDLRFTDGSKILVETRNRDNSWPEELIAVIKQVQAKDEEEERERTKEQCATRVPEGATGLSNLGNTCFMNSSLQCISNLTPLTTYFREKDYTYEINKQNPLGTKGAIAKRYGDLVQDLWSGQNKSIVPWRFRLTVAHHAPQFNNFQQQDAQELLAFVLDSLHEDLNRVKVKPYRELRDSDDRPVAEVADEAWTYHRERNDSVIVDLLQGQLKSIVECTECSYKSMKFDPFTFLSLPLPLDSSTTLEVIVIRLDGSQPIRYSMRQELDGKYGTLRETLQDSTHIHYLLLVDVFGGIIRVGGRGD